MYRILIADDEGIMVESLKRIIEQNFSDTCEVTAVRSCRAAIEQAELVHPDIVFMDIQMPGINGLDAMREIRKFNSASLFYVISAYDKFDYAKEAIAQGVEKYMMKPVSRSVVISTVSDAIHKVEERRKRLSDQLKVQEKLETVIPVVENGFVGSILMQNAQTDYDYYRQLLDITEENAFVILLAFGMENAHGEVRRAVKTDVQAQSFFPQVRAIVKSYLRCCIGEPISNRIVLIVPCPKERMEYEERIHVIGTVSSLVDRLEEKLGIRFRAGIGRVCSIKSVFTSYQEASLALQESESKVIHTDDISQRGVYEDDFPVNSENHIFELLDQGRTEEMTEECNRFYDWMLDRHPDSMNNIRLKILEYVLRAETQGFKDGALNYSFDLRKDYLSDVLALEDPEKLRLWFLEKMASVSRSIANKKQDQSQSVVSRAKAYIQEHYMDEISLDEVSREVNISPYYFSKLFKEEAGENFIDYLTRIRIEKAKQLLAGRSLSISEISTKVGYRDSNYFSRIFKKQTDKTPREYREEMSV